MKITPLGNTIQLEIQEATAGGLDTSMVSSAVEYAKVLAVNSKVPLGFKPGDYVFVKAWAIDIINHLGKKYYFVNMDTNGILAKVQ